MARCLCGGGWRLANEMVIPAQGHWYDALVVRCSRCGSLGRFLFDISGFYEARPRTWADYGQAL